MHVFILLFVLAIDVTVCPFSSSLFKLSFCRWSGGTDHLFSNVTSAPALPHVQIMCCCQLHLITTIFCLGKSFRLNICLCVLYHYASMHLWLKLLCLDFCLCLLKIIIAINHSTVYHYLIAFVVWYHDGIFQCIDLCHWWSHWT